MSSKPPDTPSSDAPDDEPAALPDTGPDTGSDTSTDAGPDSATAAKHHDALFKSLFSDPVQAAAQLQAILPPRVARHIDWDSLQPVHASFVNDLLEQRHGDLLFSARLTDGRPAFLWLLFEHQSWPWRVRHPHRMKPRRVRGRGDTGGARTEEVGLNGWPARGRYVTWCHEPVPELDREPHEHPILLPCGPRPREHAL